MNGSDINFNPELRMSIKIAEEPKSVLLEISDSLAASEQKLLETYKNRIADFINASGKWYKLASDRIKKEDGEQVRIRLLRVFILSEQDADPIIFGLMFWADVDIEHQRGLKMDGRTLEILEYGIGDVAFS